MAGGDITRRPAGAQRTVLTEENFATSAIAAYDRGLAVLAGAGAGCIVFILVAVVYDVVRRTLGFGSAVWVSALTEYALLYTVALAAPWLTRLKGHIMIESLVDTLPPRARQASELFACSLGMALCLVLGYYFAVSGWESFKWNEADMRAITLPRWVMYFPMPLMFGLTAVEFARFLFGPRHLLSGHGSKTDGM